MLWQRSILVGMLGCAALLAGCGGKPMGTVSGTASFAGEPIAFGTVAFLAADGWTSSTAVTAGKYELKDVPVGKMKITMMAVPPPPAMPQPGGPITAPSGRAAPFRPLPPQYVSADLTPLTYEVKAGQQTHNIDVPAK